MPSTKEDYHLMQYGFDYYVAARAAVRAGIMPVPGNLVHHAVELFLKAGLSDKHCLEELGKKFGHNLPRLWKAFKAEFPGKGFEEFDPTIALIDKFERIRYPDNLIQEGGWISIGWAPIASAGGGGKKSVPRYEIAMPEIDRLVAKIFGGCSKNPVFFTGGLNKYARAAFTYRNPVRRVFFPRPKKGTKTA